MAKKIRTFVAIEIPPAIDVALARLLKKMSTRAPDVRWTLEQTRHVTLKFLGEIGMTEVGEACMRLKRLAAGLAPFEVQLAGLGAFPDLEHPRTLWCGVQDENGELAALHQAVDSALLELGHPAESRRFAPHITLGRANDAAQGPHLTNLLAEFADFSAGWIDVDELVVFSSELRREGPVHEPLGRLRFGAKAARAK